MHTFLAEIREVHPREGNHTQFRPRGEVIRHSRIFTVPRTNPARAYLLRLIECFSVARISLGVRGGGVEKYAS